jgi:hypothetical protein
MKATLEFNLKDEDDLMAHMRVVHATDMALVLWELVHNTKRNIEREIELKDLDGYATLDLFYNKLHEELDTHGIIIDKLIS